MPLLTFAKQQEIKPISANNEKRYVQIQAEAEEYYLIKLIGAALLQKIQAEPTAYADLLNGSEFDYCGENIRHKGLLYVLAYFTFSKYVFEIGITDTFTGFASKERAEASNAREGELQRISSSAKKMAYQAWTLVEAFIKATYSSAPSSEKIGVPWMVGVKRT